MYFNQDLDSSRITSTVASLGILCQFAVKHRSCNWSILGSLVLANAQAFHSQPVFNLWLNIDGSGYDWWLLKHPCWWLCRPVPKYSGKTLSRPPSPHCTVQICTVPIKLSSSWSILLNYNRSTLNIFAASSVSIDLTLPAVTSSTTVLASLTHNISNTLP